MTMPPDGWRLRAAIITLVREPHRPLAAMIPQAESMLPSGDVGLKYLRHGPWLDICEQVERGELIARGFLHGQKQADTIDTAFLVGAVANFDENTLEVHGVVYANVRIFPREKAPEPAPPPVPRWSERELSDWFRHIRVPDWPAGKPPPSEALDRVAAETHFGTSIPRGEFRRVRAASTPENWRKSGRPRVLPNPP